MRLKHKNPIRPINQQSGFTLIESLVGKAIFGVSFVSLYAGIAMGFTIIGSARENLRATQVMVEKMETIRLYTFKPLQTPGVLPTTFSESFQSGNGGPNATEATSGGLVYHGTLRFEDGPGDRSYQAYLKRVTINLSWNSRGREHNRSMTTYVTRHGLQNYVY
jgi:prepilin-type N-terminal cleavage/methylation domain-containing protein